MARYSPVNQLSLTTVPSPKFQPICVVPINAQITGTAAISSTWCV
jgi:hypothetical protein